MAGLNRNRRVFGPVHTECPGQLHTAPFGNWGVASNFGGVRNGHQFQGWCHDTPICDNNGNCSTDCRDGWYEWNSCTDIPQFQPPNCTLYNDSDCTAQMSPLGVNVMSTRTLDIPVRCPMDLDNDGVADAGGCRDVRQARNGDNFMSLYELDPLTGNDLVQTLYFPPTPVPLDCSVTYCPPAGSDWVPPSGYADPPSPRVFAEMAMVVNSGQFIDPARACPALITGAEALSAATFTGATVAPASIVSLFGHALATQTLAAPSPSLPLALAGTSVRVRDSTGLELTAPLYFVSPGQVNCVLPEGLRVGPAEINVLVGGHTVATASVQLAPVAPGLFTANSDGAGVPAALLQRVMRGGEQRIEPVFTCGSGPNGCFPAELDSPAGGEDVYLLLFGTGIRANTGLPAVSVLLGGQPLEVQYAGAQPQYPGLDQINARLPRNFSGHGTLALEIQVDGQAAPSLELRFR